MLNYIFGGIASISTAVGVFYVVAYYKTSAELSSCNAALSISLQNVQSLENAVELQNSKIKEIEVDVQKYKNDASKYRRKVEQRYEGVNISAVDCEGVLNASNEMLNIYFNK